MTDYAALITSASRLSSDASRLRERQKSLVDLGHGRLHRRHEQEHYALSVAAAELERAAARMRRTARKDLSERQAESGGSHV